MRWNPGPAQIKGISPTDFNKANILAIESWERAGEPDRVNRPGSLPTQQVSIWCPKYVCGSLLLIERKVAVAFLPLKKLICSLFGK